MVNLCNCKPDSPHPLLSQSVRSVAPHLTLHGRGSRTESTSRSPPGKSVAPRRDCSRPWPGKPVASNGFSSSQGKSHSADLSPSGKSVTPVEFLHHVASGRTPPSFSAPGKWVAPRRLFFTVAPHPHVSGPGKSVAPIASFSSPGKLSIGLLGAG